MPNMKKNKKGIILLSSGLDSVVSLKIALKKCEIILALTFDYGQKAAVDEIKAAKKISKKYNIKHEVIKLPFLSKITDNALTNESKTLKFNKIGQNSADCVWVSNRNGLFLNIAAAYADSLNADYIIYGGNKEEAETFSDNSIDFIKAINRLFKYSTKIKSKILAPCANFKKYEIIQKGIDLGVDFSLIKSCYNSSKNGKNHCGVCESCIRLKDAIIKSENKDLINLIF